jgi:release factor glutamine methyltransferase
VTWTVRSVLAWAKGYLEGKGVENPRLDAEVLLSHALGRERIHLYLDMDRPLSGEELSAFRVLLKRRSLREPVAYILGFKEFFSHSFLVSPEVLIPRPETEILVEEAVKLSPPESEVFELGVGSGAVIVSILLERPDLTGCGNDTSRAALKIARENARRHGVSERLDLFAGSCFAALSGKYETIVANPPYVALVEKDTLKEEVLRFEPGAALFAGNDGLDVIREILCSVQNNLVPGGRLIMETGGGQRPEVERIVRSNRSLRLVRWVKDLAGIDRAVVVERTHG